jgi:DMSO/TMAO reductase YedYZ molybdopterin-dependent catalytic subunit
MAPQRAQPGATGAGGASTSPSAASAVPGAPAPGEAASGPFAIKGLSPEVTPTESFYTVSKNFLDPSVDVGKWSLTIDGLVERPTTFDYDAIRQLPAFSDFYTLQCISNNVGGDLWGNAHWKGVRLQDLLTQAGLKAGARKVVFHAADDYTDSIALERAMNSLALLAYEMNGAPLEKAHGFPARLLIPNIYGMKNVKWVTRIEVVDFDFKGYWQQRGWDDAAPYNVSSRIDVPHTRDSLSTGEVPIGGVAFAGDRGIQAVEYSVDDGQTWQPATLKPALSPNSWQLWAARPTLGPGRYSIKVRAVDGKGTEQISRNRDSFPGGATGYDISVVFVS